MTEREIVDTIRAVLARAHFVVSSPLQLVWDEFEREELRWEIYHGQLLGESMTRETRTFRAWNVRGIVEENPNVEPLVSIKQDTSGGMLYVTRGLLCYGHRVISTGNVIETREDVIWSRELVGAIDPTKVQIEDLHFELSHLVFAAIVGTSHLPLTSVEAPLPDFSLGRLAYFPSSNARAYEVKRLELLLRSPTPIESIAAACPPASGLPMLRDVYLGISLSPYTNFVGRSLALLREWETQQAITAAQRIDFLGWLIRLQWRHLNAYDLFLFHHRGANYPDALLLDEVLRDLLVCAHAKPEAFVGDVARLRRRALRWGWFLRAIYAGHRVPRHPTSPGENNRVLPAQWTHLSDEEISNPYRRSHELFHESLKLSSSTQKLLQASVEELIDEGEMRELGTALILDRPLGWSKSIGESDLTPPLAYIARSRKLAFRHIEQLERHGTNFFPARLADDVRQRLATINFPGIPMPHLDRPARPGVLSLTDAFQTADDFVIDRTTRRSIDGFRQHFEWSGVEGTNDPHKWRMILPKRTEDSEVLEVFDEQQEPWLKLSVDASAGFRTRLGVELPVRGFQARLSNGSTIKVLPR